MRAPSQAPTLEPAADVARVAASLRAHFGLPASPETLRYAAILEETSDVGGAVVLAEVVSAGAPDEAELDTPQVDDGRWLAAHVREQLASLDRFVERRLARPFSAPSALPDASGLVEMLSVARPESDAAARAVADIARRIEQRLVALVRTLRREAGRIRSEVAAELRKHGARAAYLERLDAALRRCTKNAVVQRDQALGELFAQAARAGFEKRMPDDGTAPDAVLVERWARRGFYAHLIHELGRVARAVAAEEHALLMHLVRAVAGLKDTESKAAPSAPAAAAAAEDSEQPTTDAPSDPEGVAA